MNDICVQDPMCLTHNVADLVDHKYCMKFFSDLLVASSVFLESKLLNPSSESWGLISILDRPEEVSMRNHRLSESVSFSVPLISKCGDRTVAEIERASVSSDALLKILQDVFLFQFTPLDEYTVLDLLKTQDKLISKSKRKQKSSKRSKSDLRFLRSSLHKNLVRNHLLVRMV
ncbi:poly(A) RNA polymerase, mitochondrial [Caerostris extrusa]|uniref:Poly(A) RNA polymerase, mitochondrial n=1 Tax=Caerostris extrusa TaxID=172846 RepID=A0AAV4XUQ1_CAEEX|nr:poly(A) RNA polymerase, mitochondrial [Caerostris extrusa]